MATIEQSVLPAAQEELNAANNQESELESGSTPGEIKDDYSSSRHLDFSLMRDPKPEDSDKLGPDS